MYLNFFVLFSRRRAFQTPAWQAAREQKFCTLDPGSVFKDYDFHRVQSLEEKLEDLDSLSLNYWLTKFVQNSLNSFVKGPDIGQMPC